MLGTLVSGNDDCMYRLMRAGAGIQEYNSTITRVVDSVIVNYLGTYLGRNEHGHASTSHVSRIQYDNGIIAGVTW